MAAAASNSTPPCTLVASPLTPASARAHPGRRAWLCGCLPRASPLPQLNAPSRSLSHLALLPFNIKHSHYFRPRGATCHTCCSTGRRAPARKRASCRFSVPSMARGWRRYVVVCLPCALRTGSRFMAREECRVALYPGRAPRPFLRQGGGGARARGGGGERCRQRKLTRFSLQLKPPPPQPPSLTHKVDRICQSHLQTNLDGV